MPEVIKNKVAIVTGASKGIGKAIAIKLSEEGYDLILNYRSSKESIEEYTKELKTEITLVQADVSKFDEAKKIIDAAIEKYNQIDLLVNNAGITKDNLLARMTEEDFDDVISINLKGVFNCSKHVTKKMMKQRKGKIVNISSVVGLIGNPGQVNYCASKAGVNGITKSMARELAPRNINVNAIAPGFVRTDMVDALKEDILNGMLQSVPLKRLGEASEIADLVVFLASDKANYITGQVISIDGGMAM